MTDLSEKIYQLLTNGHALVLATVIGHSGSTPRGAGARMIVLEQALKADAGYIGMIGSRKKRDTIYANLEKKGISREALYGVHCPIGLGIGAQTPEEIAVCIATQLIVHRAGRT